MAEQIVIDEHRELRELRNDVDAIADGPLGDCTLIRDVSLPNATTVRINHGLGRKPRCKPFLSAPDGTTASGRIEFVSSTDRYIELQANGYGATVTIDVLVL